MTKSPAKRRDNGSGTISLRKDGRWEAKLYISATKKYKSVYATSEAAVKKKLRALQEDIVKGQYIEIKDQSVYEFIKDWLDNIDKNNVKPRTRDTKESTLENQIKKYFEFITVAKVQSSDVQIMIDGMINDNLSFSSIRKAYNLINQVFKYGLAVVPPLVARNPTNGVKLPRKRAKSKSDITYFKKDEVQKIVEVCRREYGNENFKKGIKCYRLGYAVILLMYTGLRIGEALALTWDDIDFKEQTITVRTNTVIIKDRSQNDKSGKKTKRIVQDTTKTNSSSRIVNFGSTALDALNHLKEINGKAKYVFASSTGNMSDPSVIDRMFRSIQIEAGTAKQKTDSTPNDKKTDNPTKVKYVTYGIHACRHTYATMLILNDVDIKIVSQLLGHASIAITYDTYVHIIEEQKAKAVQLIDM